MKGWFIRLRNKSGKENNQSIKISSLLLNHQNQQKSPKVMLKNSEKSTLR